MKDNYSIGEFSSLFGLNVQTLRYYDSIGLFKPDFRENWSGRRYYSFDQVYKLASIRYLRKLGYSLQDIISYMDNRQPQVSIDILKKRSEEIHQQLQDLLMVDDIIQRKIDFIQEELTKITSLSEISIKAFDQRQYIPVGSEEVLYFHDSFYFYPTIAFYEGEGKYFGGYIIQPSAKNGSPTEESNLQIQTEIIEAGNYLCGYHQGPYETILERTKQIRDSHPELKLSALSINFNIIDQFVEKNGDNYITSIQIRILDPN